MSVEFIPADRLHSVAPQRVTELENGGRRSEPGNHGLVLFSPDFAAQDGVFRAWVDARVTDGHGTAGFNIFDRTADCRLYTDQAFVEPFDVVVRVYDTATLEFRFTSEGAAFEVIGVTWEPVLLDRAPASADHLCGLAREVLDRRGEPAAFFRLLDRLLDLGETEAAERLRSDYVHRHQDLASTVQALLLQVHAPTGAQGPVTDRGGDYSDAELTAAVWSRRFRSIDLFGLTRADQAELVSLGYKLAFLYATRHHREAEEPSRLWHARPTYSGGLGHFPPRQPLFERYPDIDRSYQAALARGDGIAAYDPVDGRLLRSRHGFLALYCDLPFVFYRFEGAEVFYLCTGHISSAKLFLYLPRTETIVVIADPWYRNYAPADMAKRLNADMIRGRELIGDYLRAPTRPAAVVGSNIHGHYFWTELTGLDFALNSGLTEGLAEIVRLEREFVDPLKIFPELADKPAPFFSDPDQAFRHCLSHHLLPIHFTDIAMGAGFVDRIRRAAQDNASPHGYLPQHAPRPLIWINLRAHNKIWIEQAEGYANILNALYDEHGAVSAFVDGMADCAPILAQIRSSTRAEIPLYDGLHPNTFDSLNWAFQVDAYIVVIGSSLMVVNALADRVGVAHAEHAHLQQMEWWPTVRPGLTPPLTPEKTQVIEIGEGLYTNYSLDWRVLLDLIRRVLAKRELVTVACFRDVDSPIRFGRPDRARVFTPDQTGFSTTLKHRFDGAVLRVEANQQGEFLRGPSASDGGCQAGLYQATAIAKALGGADGELFWSIVADGRVCAGQRFHEDGTVFLVLPETRQLQFRFSAMGAEILLEAIELEPLLLDGEPLTPTLAVQIATQARGSVGEQEAGGYLRRRLESA